MRKLADAGNAKECTGQATTVISDPDENCCSGELDAILVIKQLQEKVFFSYLVYTMSLVFPSLGSTLAAG